MSMVMWIGFVFLVLVGMFGRITGLADLTRMEGQKGAEVVQAVVDQVRGSCIFPQDRLFMRRLAFVVSQDGMDSKTYRPGYYGGIWQVDENMFRATQTCPASIVHLCNLISANLGIDWHRVQWQDLLKPLYSGLAAALSIQRIQGSAIPGDLTAQSLIWKNIYHPQPPMANFSALVQTQTSCDTAIDLAFIIDSSNNTGSIDFQKTLVFLQKVVNELNVSRDGTHVSVVRFSNYPSVQFKLNQYYTQYSLNQRIRSIYYDGGGINTADAIHEVANVIFTTSAGARKDAAKVAVVVTAGPSNSFIATTTAADAAKKKGIVFFTIGVGGVNPLELAAVASDPNCTHYFLLKDFTEIDSMVYEIQRSSCRAPVSFEIDRSKESVEVTADIKPASNTTGSSGTGTVTKVVSIKTYTPSTTPGTNSTDNDTFISILTTVNCGVVYVYASYEITHPGPAFHDVKGVATGDLPSVLYVNTSVDGRPLYIAYSGQDLVNSNGTLNNCNYSTYSYHPNWRPPKAAEVICRDEDGERECTKTDFVTSKYNKFLCRDNWAEVPNPCTPDVVNNNNLYHPHPYDNTKFIKCDLKGDMYVIQCPGHKRYVPDSHVCGTEHAIINNNKKLLVVDNIPNPCTLQNIRNNKMFFPYPGVLNKYLHCTPDGTAWENSCQDGYLWLQDAQTCYPDYQHQHLTSTQATFTNPCTKANWASGKKLFLYPPDSNKYVQCDSTGIYYIRSCLQFMHFDVTKNECVKRGE